MAEEGDLHGTSRHEFRVFGADLGPLHAALAARGRERSDETRKDVYILLPGRPDVSFKLRDRDLDMKLMDAREEGLERWRPAGSAALPLPRDELARLFLAPLGLGAGDAPEWLDANALLRLARERWGARILDVVKRRRRYAIGETLGEWTALSVAEATPLETLALEDADPGRLAAEVAALGLLPAQNVGYPAFLAALPS
jgi:hypothetical protein